MALLGGVFFEGAIPSESQVAGPTKSLCRVHPPNNWQGPNFEHDRPEGQLSFPVTLQKKGTLFGEDHF